MRIESLIGLSRGMFTKESKMAAMRLVEGRSSIGEVARALEVNPNVLHRWRRNSTKVRVPIESSLARIRPELGFDTLIWQIKTL